ncbi:hypothetical protein GGQ99_004741 [Aminobacter niigataensis]|uniref:Uncharacterized protein n=1 Tax=Aminobacter niigataensis TaxID=83265 RepID=A0ABR6L826_9HYPH|nr:hypothetical protein [Aminobacter niigataensis]MBB4652957.1 hypothetical protein [Aminobacter niigataensis]
MSAATFRVHFADGTTVDVTATDPKGARTEAEKVHSAHIRKIKVVRAK